MRNGGRQSPRKRLRKCSSREFCFKLRLQADGERHRNGKSLGLLMQQPEDLMAIRLAGTSTTIVTSADPGSLGVRSGNHPVCAECSWVRLAGSLRVSLPCWTPH